LWLELTEILFLDDRRLKSLKCPPL
jgi:hypothetical protein